MEAETQADQTAELTVARNADFDIKMRGLEVYVDGEFAHDLAYPKTWVTKIKPGKHTVKVSNHLYKESIEIDAVAGQRVELLAGNRFTVAGGIMVAVLGMGPYRVFLSQVPANTRS